MARIAWPSGEAAGAQAEAVPCVIAVAFKPDKIAADKRSPGARSARRGAACRRRTHCIETPPPQVSRAAARSAALRALSRVAARIGRRISSLVSPRSRTAYTTSLEGDAQTDEKRSCPVISGVWSSPCDATLQIVHAPCSSLVRRTTRSQRACQSMPHTQRIPLSFTDRFAPSFSVMTSKPCVFCQDRARASPLGDAANDQPAAFATGLAVPPSRGRIHRPFFSCMPLTAT